MHIRGQERPKKAPGGENPVKLLTETLTNSVGRFVYACLPGTIIGITPFIRLRAGP